jgi:hypothetical protein
VLGRSARRVRASLGHFISALPATRGEWMEPSVGIGLELGAGGENRIMGH